MISLPFHLFRHILSCKGPKYEYARRFGAPSADWAGEYTNLAPCAEYEMINNRIVVLYWGRPYMSARGWDLDLMLSTRPSS